MIRRRSFILSVTSSIAIAACLPRTARAATTFPFITGDADDPHYTQPYIDIEEWRDAPGAATSPVGDTTQRAGGAAIKVRHLYVHGGFKGTDTKFTFCFPPKEQYQGRFYQPTHQLLTDENSAPPNIAMAIAAGAYLVQSNMGGNEIARSAEDNASDRVDGSIGNYRANAAAAKYSRVVASRIYGPGTPRPFGYLYGGSGGAFQTIDSAQNTHGVWDGFIPYVMANPATTPAGLLARAHALRVVGDKWPAVIDALEPGGGDPYAVLNAEQKVALDEATRYGFPPRAWANYVPQGTGPLGFIAAFVPLLDPGYLTDFWTKPGYIVANSSAKQRRIQMSAKVVRVIEQAAGGQRSAFSVGTQLEVSDAPPSGDMEGTDLIGASGEGKGLSAPIGDVKGKIVSFRLGAQPAVVAKFKVGDTVTFDNSNYIAMLTYYRHSLPKAGSVHDFPAAIGSFRGANYPQRDINVGLGQKNLNPAVPQGKIHGKMIQVQCLMDGDAFPWMAAWYHERVRAEMGAAYDDNHRIWFIDHAQHTPPTTDAARTHVTTYSGVLEQGLRDLSAWVEKGVTPPPSTAYTVKDGQVQVPASAAARKGIQPTVDLKVNGGARAEVAAGQPVNFTAAIETPPGMGSVVRAEWDFEGTGAYPTAGKLTKGARATVTASHTYTKPGTYFAAIRATSHRQGNAETPYERIHNLGRVRVVVK